MRWKRLGVVAALAAGAGLLLVPSASVDRRLATMGPVLQHKLDTRSVQVDPGEVLDTLYNNSVAIELLDVRDEVDYNLFHLADAVRVDFARLRNPTWVGALPRETVIVLMSNDEGRATAAWKLLAAQGVPNLYILAGGINGWLAAYGDYAPHRSAGTGAAPLIVASPRPLPEMVAPGARPDSAPIPLTGPAAGAPGDDRLRYAFSMALGGRHPASDPDPAHVAKRAYVKKIKLPGATSRKSGGCG